MENDKRCAWCRGNALLAAYHDREWGAPVHDDRLLFEHLSLEVLQCGLSWLLMLKKREIFHRCLADFRPESLAAFTEKDVEAALATPGMIRSRRKIEAVVNNACAFLALQREQGSFSAWIWGFTNGAMRIYSKHEHGIPPRNELSDAVSAELRARGFRFLGSVTVYAFLQACGLVNDHERSCPRFREVSALAPRVVFVEEP